MELNDRDKRDGYVYDPKIKEYDTSFWKSTTGTPAFSTPIVRYNADASASFGQHIFADVEFNLTVPVKPTAAQARFWGLRFPVGTGFGAIYFEVTGTTFQAVSVGPAGTSETTAITWVDGTWTAAAISYRIRWENDEVRFYVNGTLYATHVAQVPQTPLPLMISNSASDNLDLNYLAVRRSAAII